MKKHILHGAQAVIPIALVYMAIRFVYVSIDKTILSLVHDSIGIRPPGPGMLVTLLVFYLLGLFASSPIGRLGFPGYRF